MPRESGTNGIYRSHETLTVVSPSELNVMGFMNWITTTSL